MACHVTEREWSAHEAHQEAASESQGDQGQYGPKAHIQEEGSGNGRQHAAGDRAEGSIGAAQHVDEQHQGDQTHESG